MSEITPPTSTQTQTWATIITAIAGAVAAAFAKARFTRAKAAPGAKAVTHTEFQQGLDTLRASNSVLSGQIQSNQKEMLSALTQHSTTIEKRLDALESAVARLDERTRNCQLPLFTIPHLAAPSLPPFPSVEMNSHPCPSVKSVV